MSSSLGWLIAARAVQGVGAAGLMSVNAALVRLTYPRAQLGKGMAINSMVVAASSVAGPSVAAAVLAVADWPWLFAINLPLGVAVLWLGWRALPANVGPALGDRMRVLDVLLNVGMFSLFFLGVDRLIFTSYLESCWQVFANHADGLDAEWLPMAGQCAGASLGATALLLAGAVLVMRRRDISG